MMPENPLPEALFTAEECEILHQILEGFIIATEFEEPCEDLEPHIQTLIQLLMRPSHPNLNQLTDPEYAGMLTAVHYMMRDYRNQINPENCDPHTPEERRDHQRISHQLWLCETSILPKLARRLPSQKRLPSQND